MAKYKSAFTGPEIDEGVSKGLSFSKTNVVNSQSTHTDVPSAKAVNDAIDARAEVNDLVANHVALLNYPTSGLRIGFKIKVLRDETQDDAKAYYNWTGTVWELIATESNDLMERPATATQGNLAVFDANRNVTDGGIALAKLLRFDASQSLTGSVVETTGSATTVTGEKGQAMANLGLGTMAVLNYSVVSTF